MMGLSNEERYRPKTGSFAPFEDNRGILVRVFDELALGDVKFHVSQASVSWNPTKGTLRGLHSLHISAGESKLVTCVRGRVWDVAVNVDETSDSYLSYWSFELDGSRGDWVLIPPGYAHGFITLSSDALVTYMMSAPYNPLLEKGFRYDDPAFSISWPFRPSLISEKDASHPLIGNG